MKRKRIELDEIAAYANLHLATWKAARGKRSRPDVARFIEHLDTHLAQMAENILAERVPCGHYREFLIHDPKRRRIHAACFVDRVLHHAIMNLAEPVFERSLVPTTYACRPGKGVHLAVTQVQKNLRRFPWFAQVDVDGYFPAIDHSCLMSLLECRFKGSAFLRLLFRIIESYHSAPDKGLPIGSLTSQHFANYYLDGADRWLLAHPAVYAHVRYMDDILWWCRDRHSALQILSELTAYFDKDRSLTLKSNARINRSARGLTYCGFRISPGAIRLTLRKQRRYRQLRQRYENAWQTNMIDSLGLQSAYDAVLGSTFPADSRSWRRRDLQLHPIRYKDISG